MTYEGPVAQLDGSFTYSYRTNYKDAACIKNNVFESDEYRSGSDPNGNNTFNYQNTYLKVMLNLRPIGATSTTQNVLFVARYPVTLTTVSSFASLPYAQCGVLPQASTATVQAICSGSKYTTAIAMRKSGAGAPASTNASKPTQSIVAYPNPTTSEVHLILTTTQAGPTRVFLSDALGREVAQVLEENRPAAGTFEITASVSSLRPGIYYCTLQALGQHVTQKLVVVP